MKTVVTRIGQRIGAFRVCPSSSHIQLGLLLFGVSLLAFGLVELADAQGGTSQTYNDLRFRQILAVIFKFLNGAFGALIMVIAGIGAIFSAAFGGYKAALSLLMVAVGAFVLRSLVFTFFNVGDGVEANEIGNGTRITDIR